VIRLKIATLVTLEPWHALDNKYFSRWRISRFLFSVYCRLAVACDQHYGVVVVILLSRQKFVVLKKKKPKPFSLRRPSFLSANSSWVLTWIRSQMWKSTCFVQTRLFGVRCELRSPFPTKSAKKFSRKPPAFCKILHSLWLCFKLAKEPC
jgi:hypothetical protein